MIHAYLLDTNIASYVIKGNIPCVRERLVSVPMSSVAISSITQAELLYGLAKCGRPEGLARRIHEFLVRVDVLPWDQKVSSVYGDLRAACEADGLNLGALDMMIAAHAVAVDAILITRDQSFARVPKGLKREDWTIPISQP